MMCHDVWAYAAIWRAAQIALPDMTIY